VVIVPVLFRIGGGVDDIVIRRIVEDLSHSPEGIGENFGGRAIQEGLHLFITWLVNLRKNPGLKGKSRSKGSDGDEPAVLCDDPTPLPKLLPDDIAVNASVFIEKVIFRPFDLLPHPRGNNGEGNDLGM
jgi:hypothetical protein